MVVNINNGLNVNNPGATVSFRSPIFMRNPVFNSLVSINMGLCSSNGMTASRPSVYFMPTDPGSVPEPACNYIFAGNHEASFNMNDPVNMEINNTIATIQLSPGSPLNGRGGKTILNSVTPSNQTVSLVLPPKSGTIALTNDISETSSLTDATKIINKGFSNGISSWFSISLDGTVSVGNGVTIRIPRDLIPSNGTRTYINVGYDAYFKTNV